MTMNQAPIDPLTNDLSKLSLAELFAEADRIGNQYQTAEERSAQLEALIEIDVLILAEIEAQIEAMPPE
ncbi:MAG: hypothetical protein ACRC62_03035 [Microcoleus sp.]